MCNGNNNRRVRRGIRLRLSKNRIKLKTLKSPEHQERRDQEAKVTDTVDNESFRCRVRIRPGGTPERIQFEPEADQQERAKSHTLPADEEHQIRIARDEDHHHGDEQVQVNKEAAEAFFLVLEADILVHIPDRVDVDESPN